MSIQMVDCGRGLPESVRLLDSARLRLVLVFVAKSVRPVEMEHPVGIDSSLVVFQSHGIRVLLTVAEDPIFGQLMKPGHRLAGLPRLPCRKTLRTGCFYSIDRSKHEDMNPGFLIDRQPRVIGGTLIGKSRGGGKGIVMDKMTVR
mgnify:CR=1 FL=1